MPLIRFQLIIQISKNTPSLKLSAALPSRANQAALRVNPQLSSFAFQERSLLAAVAGKPQPQCIHRPYCPVGDKTFCDLKNLKKAVGQGLKVFNFKHHETLFCLLAGVSHTVMYTGLVSCKICKRRIGAVLRRAIVSVK